MKKTILFALMVVGLTVSFFVGISESQEQRKVQILTPQGIVAVVHIIEDRSVQIQRLRNEVLKLSQQQIQTMNQEELNAKKAELQKELSEELQATAKLQQAIEFRKQAKKLLQEILRNYPKSLATRQASMLLESQKRAESIAEYLTESPLGRPAATVNESNDEKRNHAALLVLRRQAERVKAIADRSTIEEHFFRGREMVALRRVKIAEELMHQFRVRKLKKEYEDSQKSKKDQDK